MVRHGTCRVALLARVRLLLNMPATSTNPLGSFNSRTCRGLATNRALCVLREAINSAMSPSAPALPPPPQRRIGGLTKQLKCALIRVHCSKRWLIVRNGGIDLTGLLRHDLPVLSIKQLNFRGVADRWAAQSAGQ